MSLTKLFNIIGQLESDIIRDYWTIGLTQPMYMYKKMANINDPDNYRGKLFTVLSNARIINYQDKLQLIVEEQAGFRGDYSTVDHIYLI